jgi:hypothetical protein
MRPSLDSPASGVSYGELERVGDVFGTASPPGESAEHELVESGVFGARLHVLE